MEEHYTGGRIENEGRSNIISSLNNVKKDKTTYAMFSSSVINVNKDNNTKDTFDVGITIFYENVDGATMTVDTNARTDAARCVIMNVLVSTISSVFGETCKQNIRLNWNGNTLIMYIPETEF